MPLTTTTAVDDVFIYIMAFSFLLFAAIIFLTVFFVVRYRRSANPEPADISGNPLLEAGAIAVMLLLVLSMFFYGLTGFKFLRTAPAGSLEVSVTARQWSWLFQYPDGRKSADLVVPQGADVALTLGSVDVIHGFFAPAYRIKQDVVPGMKTRAWFKATSLGSSDILCTQYCGLQHSKMLSKIYVIPPAEYARWLAGEEVELAGMAPRGETREGEAAMRERGCLDCHSLDGSKLVGPTFKGLYGSTIEVVSAGKQRSVTVDDAYLARAILEPGSDIAVGYRNLMPAAKAAGAYTDAQVDEMVEFIKNTR
jgi:cytochrome c oxidase subunit 2